MMVIHVNLELQQSVDMLLPRVVCIFKVLTEPGVGGLEDVPPPDRREAVGRKEE
jgi:hypothetical protein